MKKFENKKIKLTGRLAEAFKHTDEDVQRYVGAISEEYFGRIDAIKEALIRDSTKWIGDSKR